MDIEKVEEFKSKLLVMQKDLSERVEKLENRKKRVNGPLDANSTEQAVQLQSKDVIDALDDQETKELGQISLALRSIDAGSYGVCTKCSEEVSESRLLAIPFTNICLQCAEDK